MTKHQTLVLAEPGSCHEGRLDLMLELMDVAVDCGASVMKNQWVTDPQRLCDRRRAPEYYDSYCKLAYPLEWHRALRYIARSRGLQYGCSVYLPEDVRAVAPHVDYLKISSFEADDEELLVEACKHHERVIVSTGMQERRDYGQAVVRFGVAYRPWAWLHCVSAYPAPLEDLNLDLLSGNGLPDGEPLFHGFSDHSRDQRVGAWAVCAGAGIVEVHYRLNSTTADNADYGTALAPHELKLYVRHIRDVEVALGDGVKRVQPSEAAMTNFKAR